MISQQAYLCAGTHDYTKVDLPLITLPIDIGPEAWVCARAFVGPGVKIGEGAVVAACAVVVKDVRPWMIVGGNPAKEIKARQLEGQTAP
jgi:putative colanic acid biosynthesis acetyltransferase WcaF